MSAKRKSQSAGKERTSCRALFTHQVGMALVVTTMWISKAKKLETSSIKKSEKCSKASQDFEEEETLVDCQ
ncbi:unnamed protein product [Prunus armeniaca]|uniref:Uncharacterized protein n=1 Tax=Prunus armeniaca TaxID=36596 RepID=A0A6J5Y9B4_PRUAR|nr:unnamed protein product [Prunus armeniaca]CAB4320128.1 unnamed protein product [Prunus armeniaca]